MTWSPSVAPTITLSITTLPVPLGDILILPFDPLLRVIVPVLLFPVLIIMSVSPTDWINPELTDVKIPVDGAVAPITVPSIAPPSTSTASLFCVAILPVPIAVLASAASAAVITPTIGAVAELVPPKAIGTIPDVISWPFNVK